MAGVLAAGPVLAGCEPSGNGGTEPSAGATTMSGPSVAADVPRGYDPCKNIPDSVLASEQLRAAGPAGLDADGGIKWRGCRWIRTDGYVAVIWTTNLTVDMTRDRHFSDPQEFTIGGRRAIATRQVQEHPDAVCTVTVEMQGGSLEFDLTNPPSNRDTGSTDTCRLARTLAEKVAPTVPATA
jgi:hypothetical protein